MSKEIDFSRRENGLVIRYLAQVLFNNLVFPRQDGIKELFSRLRFGNGQILSLHLEGKWEYYFLFHLADFGSKDNSEIDLIVRNGDVLFLFEIKAFTNPNDSNVKREIIRNYITVDTLIRTHPNFFSITTAIFPVLLYSIPYHEYENTSSRDFNYFNESFLYKKDCRQTSFMNVWNSGQIKIPNLPDNNPDSLKKVMEISKNLLFLTWDDIYDSIKSLNCDNRFDLILNELRTKKDFTKGVKLIKG
jgi:hypothetical protein